MAATVLALVGGVCLVAAVLLTLWVRRQIQEMVRLLQEVEQGNGNRRILAPPGRLTAPLAYAINGVVQRYEEEELRARRAEEADRQLMTSLSHDIRTPLTTLIGYLDAVHRQVVTGAEREQYLETARRKAHDLKATTDELFTWCKLHSGEAALQMAPQELGELTRGVLVDWVPLLEEHGIDYAVDIPDAPFWVALDEEGYRRILNNLLQNVLVHSQAPQIALRVRQRNNEVTVRLADNGVGIAKGDLDRIFDRLYKCDPARTSHGSGLGLSIVKQLTERMAGRIEAQSKPHCGTAFCLTFPLCPPPDLQGNPKVAARRM